MKSGQILWISLGMIVCGVLLFAVPVRGAVSSGFIIADRDACVKHDYPSTNYNDTYWLAGNASGYDGTTAYFNFDLLAVPILPTTVLSAEIDLWYYVCDFAFTANVYVCNYTYWGETSVTWDTQPSYDGTTTWIASVPIVHTDAIDPAIKITVPVTTFYNTLRSNLPFEITICINSSSASANGYMQGNVRDSVANQPTLTYTYLTADIPGGIAGYDVAFLALTTLGIVAILTRKIRAEHK